MFTPSRTTLKPGRAKECQASEVTCGDSLSLWHCLISVQMKFGRGLKVTSGGIPFSGPKSRTLRRLSKFPCQEQTSNPKEGPCFRQVVQYWRFCKFRASIYIYIYVYFSFFWVRGGGGTSRN